MQIIRRKPLSEFDFGDYPDILKQVLRNRDIKSEDELSMQSKDLSHYNSLYQIDKAAKLIGQFVIEKRKIVIVGDFDADGATSTALCILALRAMGHKNVAYIVPNRFDFGYGLSPQIVDIAHQDKAELLITVDNGISSIDGVARAKKLGMKVVVTDHHLPPEELPEADAIVNPNQKDCQFESKNLAGVGVAFYTMSAVKNYLNAKGFFQQASISPPNMANYLDLVAIGTIADLVPLDKNNRILVHQGIQRIRNGKTRPGVIAILNTVNKPYKRCCTSDIAYYIGPRLNAAGRLQDMSCGIACLTNDDTNKAAQLAAQLDGLNQSRREIEQTMRDDAERLVKEMKESAKTMPTAIVLYKSDFHQGVVGIVAGRLKEAYYRPSIVFTDDTQASSESDIIKGSARSIEGVHIRDLLVRVDTLHPNLLIKFGGHAMAAGLSILKEDIGTFTQAVTELVAQMQNNLPTQASIYSDGELSVDSLNLETAHSLKFALPWGQTFEEPIFDGVFDVINQRIVGKNHLKLTLGLQGHYIDAIAFSVDTQLWPNQQAKQVKIAYKLDLNEYLGKVNPQLLVSAIEAYEHA